VTQSVFIDGAVGTTGLEIADRLSGRSEFAQIILPEDKRKDAAARREALNDADFVILCLPDDAAKEAVAMIANDRTRVIDASTAHRVTPTGPMALPSSKRGSMNGSRRHALFPIRAATRPVFWASSRHWWRQG